MTELSELKSTLEEKRLIRDKLIEEISRWKPDDYHTWKHHTTMKLQTKTTLDNEIQELEFSLQQRLKYETKLEVHRD